MENGPSTTDGGGVRLRVPDRAQVVMKVEAPDPLVQADHPVRTVWRVVQSMPGESQVLRDWRARMGSEAGKAVYRERASTIKTVNADLKMHRGLDRLRGRGLAKAKRVALWLALAYNVMHFAGALVA